MGRPKLPDDEVAIPVRLPRGLVERIDRHVSTPQFQGITLLSEGKDPFTEPLNSPARETARLRRKFIVDQIERALGDDTIFPVEVAVYAPAYGDEKTLLEVQAWVGAEAKRLTDEAPPAVQFEIERNQLRRQAREHAA